MININKLQKSIEEDMNIYGPIKDRKIYDLIEKKQMHYHSEEYLIWMNSSLFGWKDELPSNRNPQYYLDWVKRCDDNVRDNDISIETLLPYNDLFQDYMTYRREIGGGVSKDRTVPYSRWGLFKYEHGLFMEHVSETDRFLEMIRTNDFRKGIPDLHEMMSVFWALFELGHHEELQDCVEEVLNFIRVDTDEERFKKIEFISNLYDEAYKGIPLGPWKEHYRTQLSMTYVLCQSYRTQNKWDEFKKALKGVELYSQWVGSSGNYYLQGNRIRELLFMVWDNEKTEENKQRVLTKFKEQLEWGWCYEYTDCLFESVINSLTILIKIFEYDG